MAQQAAPGAVKRASFAGMLNTFLKLVKDAAARHNTAMITPDITGWFFVISSHTEQLKRQQLGQLPHLVWFAQQQQLKAPMQPAGLGSNTAGVVLKGADAALAATAAAAAAAGGANSGQDGSGGADAGSSSSRRRVLNASGRPSLPGRPFDGTILQLGGSSSSSSKTVRSATGSQPPRPSAAQQQQGAVSGAAPASATAAPAAAGSAGLQLHVAALEMLDQLLAGAQYSQAAYGYVAAAGHLHSLTSAFKMFAALPHFNAITGGWS